MWNLKGNTNESIYTTEIRLTDDVAAAAKSLQSCLTLCNPIDGSPPGSPVPGILQGRKILGRSQDGGGIGRGDHFLFYKFIERTTER